MQRTAFSTSLRDLPGPEGGAPQLPVGGSAILLALHDGEEAAALVDLLAAAGRRLVPVGTLSEALLELLRRPYDLVVLDASAAAAFEAAALIRGRPRTKEVPILFTDVPPGGLRPEVLALEHVDLVERGAAPALLRTRIALLAELGQLRRVLDDNERQLREAEAREIDQGLSALGQRTERRYRSLAEAIPHIVLTLGANGVPEYATRRWFEYTGLTLADTRTSAWRDALHPADHEASRPAWEEALATGRSYERECRIRRADGVWRWHLCRAVREPQADWGPEAWILTLTDIDDQKRAQADLLEFKRTLDLLNDGVLIFDASFRCVYANRATSSLLGAPSDALCARSPADWVSETDARELHAVAGALVSGELAVATLEVLARRDDGLELPLELTMQYLPEADDHPEGRGLMVLRDIRARRQAAAERERLYAEAQEAIRARDDFLSVASHELRTPLSTLQLQLQMLLRQLAKGGPPAADAVRDKVAMAERQGRRLARLVDELLSVSRIAAGKLELDREQVDLKALVVEVVDRMCDEFRQAGCEVEITAPEPVTGCWDAMRLEQVITNLVSNALKFGAGAPLEILVERTDGAARLAIRDHGIGIAAEDLERVFERFERAVTSRRFSGLGLGLYIVRQIVLSHGGTIHAESRLGEGATFVVELPLDAGGVGDQ